MISDTPDRTNVIHQDFCIECAIRDQSSLVMQPKRQRGGSHRWKSTFFQLFHNMQEH